MVQHGTFARQGRRLATAGALAVGLALAAVGAQAQQMGGTLVVTQPSNPPSLDAMATSSGASRNINMNVYETLYGFDEGVQPIPMLAEGLTISDDGLSYVFTLRQGVKFHNGKEMTARDVKASLERYRRVGATTNLLDPVDTIEITGDYEVTLTLHQPTPTFLEAFCSPRAPAVIIPEEDAEAAPGESSLVGTGPYMIEEYVPDSHVTLTKFAEYSQDDRYDGIDGFGGRKTAYFDTVTFRIVPEQGAQVAALEAGEVDILDQIAVPSARRVESDPDIAIYDNKRWAFLTFILNTNTPPTDNVKFREAVQVALNMEEIMGIATQGAFELNPRWAYPDTAYDPGPIGAEYYNQADADRVAALLDEAGYDGEEFVLLTDSTIPEHARSGVVIGEQLKAMGINAVINQVDWPTALDIRMRDEGWNGWTLAMGIEPYVGPPALISTLTGKRPHFVKNDPVLDELYQELILGATVEERAATFKKISEQMYKYFGVIKIGDTTIKQAARADIKGFKPFRFPRVYDVWREE